MKPIYIYICIYIYIYRERERERERGFKTFIYIYIYTHTHTHTHQSVYAVNGTSRCLFSDKYKTYKYSVGRAYSCSMLNRLVHHVISRL